MGIYLGDITEERAAELREAMLADACSFDDILAMEEPLVPGITICYIEPRHAREFLKHSPNELRRNLRAVHVDNIARDIANDKFLLTTEPIVFDFRGHGRDGHHRMAAVIKADKPIISVVSYGLDDDTISKLNSGLRRTNGDAFRMSGIDHGGIPHALSISIASLWRILRGSECTKCSYGPTPDEAFQLLEDWPQIREATKAFNVTQYKSIGGKAPESAALFVIFHKINPGLADKFATQLIEGVDLTKGSPVLALRRRLTHMMLHDPNPSGVQRWRRTAYLIMAWNHLMAGKTHVHKLQLNKRADVPRIRGWKHYIDWERPEKPQLPDFDFENESQLDDDDG